MKVYSLIHLSEANGEIEDDEFKCAKCLGEWSVKNIGDRVVNYCPFCGKKILDNIIKNEDNCVYVGETIGNGDYDYDRYKFQLDIAQAYLSNNRIEEALEQYRQVANLGHIPAYSMVADIYYKKKNYKKAWKWYTKAAEEGDSIGQYYVGCFYWEGIHVQKSIYHALEYYEKAAEQGLPQAIMAIADCYNDGIGYDIDKQKALEYYKCAADMGYVEAQYRLGIYFHNGENGNKDVVQAAYWYKKAYLQGRDGAKLKLDKCIKEMTLAQRLKWNTQKV